MVGTMLQPPWNARIYRNRHGRGTRTPMFGTRLPPSDPTPWQTEPNMTSQCFPASHGIPARVVLYRMPLQTEAPTKLELQLAVRDELVARIAELYGRRPEEIDPDWGL